VLDSVQELWRNHCTLARESHRLLSWRLSQANRPAHHLIQTMRYLWLAAVRVLLMDCLYLATGDSWWANQTIECVWVKPRHQGCGDAFIASIDCLRLLDTTLQGSFELCLDWLQLFGHLRVEFVSKIVKKRLVYQKWIFTCTSISHLASSTIKTTKTSWVQSQGHLNQSTLLTIFALFLLSSRLSPYLSPDNSAASPFTCPNV